MPTKPVSTLGALWASNANYNTGPHAGQPTKVTPSAGELANGQVAGVSYKAQWDNFALNFLTEWVENWLRLGSSAGAADAHVCETNTNGILRVEKLEGVQTNNALLAAIVGIAASTSAGVQGQGGSSSGDGVQGVSQSANPGVRGVHTGGDGPGVRGEGRLAGAGVEGVGGASGHGGVFTGGATAGDGVQGIGTAALVGVRGTGGPTNGTGVLGIAGATGGIGVEGQTINSATSTTFAVRGLTGTGDATAVWGNSSAGAGYALVAHADTTSPTRAAMRIVPQNANPGTAADGDVYFCDDGGNNNHLKVFTRSAWRGVWASTGGFAYGYAESLGTSSTSSTSPQPKVTLNVAAPNHPRQTGQVILIGRAEVAKSAAGDIAVDIFDLTAGALVEARTVTCWQASASPNERDVMIVAAYNLPAAGTRTFELRYNAITANTARIQGASLTFLGVF